MEEEIGDIAHCTCKPLFKSHNVIFKGCMCVLVQWYTSTAQVTKIRTCEIKVLHRAKLVITAVYSLYAKKIAISWLYIYIKNDS